MLWHTTSRRCRSGASPDAGEVRGVGVRHPLNNPKAIARPLLMPQYTSANFEAADQLEHQDDVKFDEAKEATEHADCYTFGAVFFAYGAVHLARLPTL